MEEKQRSAPLEEELTCPICADFYHEPVSLTCQHNFCCSCLKKAWEHGNLTCPVCQRKSSRGQPPEMANLTLKNIVEAYLLEKADREGGEGQGVCGQHRRKLRYFCEEKGEAVCNLCVESEHVGHTHSTIQEAAQSVKADLESVMETLKRKLDGLDEMRALSEHAADHIKTQSQQTAGRIRSVFGHLQQFLREEEKARLSELQREEAQKTSALQERIQQLSSHIHSLSEKMADLKSRIASEDISFLQNYNSLKESALERMKDSEPKQMPGALIDATKYLGNLSFNVWKKMQKVVQYTPVCLDENTAHPDLHISGSLLEVRDGQESLSLPDNPERFDSMLGILGGPGFCSGTHAWQVEVGRLRSWTLGVAKESMARKGVVSVQPEAGLWAVGLSNGSEYSAGTAEVGTTLPLTRRPERVLISLDCDAHVVSFSNAEDMTPIYTFKQVAEGPLYPYFSPPVDTDGALRICPETVTVSIVPVQQTLQ